VVNACEPDFRKLVRGALDGAGTVIWRAAGLRFNPDSHTVSRPDHKRARRATSSSAMKALPLFPSLVAGKLETPFCWEGQRTAGASHVRCPIGKPYASHAQNPPTVSFHHSSPPPTPGRAMPYERCPV